ncbi:MAG: GLUG motif-containing protein [Planctomycetota bacterium]
MVLSGSFTTVGGLVGTNYHSTIDECFASGDVLGGSYIGGLTGYNTYGTIINCYATGNSSAIHDSIAWWDAFAGGLVGGSAYDSAISNCYAIGVVTAEVIEPFSDICIGGLVGYQEDLDTEYQKSFWDSDVNPDVNGIGNRTDPNIIGESTANMQTESTFTDAGWDFVGEVINGPNDFWDICEETNYPKLVWQIPVGDFVCPDGVTMVDFSVLAYAWMSEPNDYNWDPNCDISEPNDNVIDESDVMVFTDNWLEGL